MAPFPRLPCGPNPETSGKNCGSARSSPRDCRSRFIERRAVAGYVGFGDATSLPPDRIPAADAGGCTGAGHHRPACAGRAPAGAAATVEAGGPPDTAHSPGRCRACRSNASRSNASWSGAGRDGGAAGAPGHARRASGGSTGASGRIGGRTPGNSIRRGYASGRPIRRAISGANGRAVRFAPRRASTARRPGQPGTTARHPADGTPLGRRPRADPDACRASRGQTTRATTCLGHGWDHGDARDRRPSSGVQIRPV